MYLVKALSVKILPNLFFLIIVSFAMILGFKGED